MNFRIDCGTGGGAAGGTRMGEQELRAELVAVYILTNFCREDVIKNHHVTGKKKVEGRGKGR